jgi:UDP-2-acetamido-2,6-beta-L-arabino-hexul-4-ose reductase
VKALVTGANGFIGKNLVVAMRRVGVEVEEIDVDSTPGAIAAGVTGTSVVFHLAGINRPERNEEFTAGNVGSLESLFAAIDQASEGAGALRPMIVLSSSRHAAQDNPYGRSKLAAEQELQTYSIHTGAPAVIYRLPGVFGKWCRPNYNSVVATFCHNITRNLPITISDPGREVELVYVDDVIAEFMTHLTRRAEGVSHREVKPTFSISVGELAARIHAFRAMRKTLEVAEVSDPFTRRLLSTYTSYLPAADLACSLEQRMDVRGTLAELLKSERFGQIFISRTKPGMTRGNHYHDSKVEKFAVLEGDAVIRFRHILDEDVIDYLVSGKEFRVVDIPPGYTHSIQNVGQSDLIVLFWAYEPLNPADPDTYPLNVRKE